MVKVTRFNFALILLFTAFVSILLFKGIDSISAHGGDTSLIHSCVKTSNGSIRIVGVNDSCNGGETSLDWTQNGNTGIGGFNEFISKNLPGYDATMTFTWEGRNMDGANFSGGSFYSGTLGVSFDFKNMKNASFVGVNLSNLNPNWFYADVSNSNFTNANLSGNLIGLLADNTNFTGANFSDVSFDTNILTSDLSSFSSTNFTNANFTNAYLQGIDLTTTTLTGAIWNNTTCPDGTNSDSHSNTCVGHLVP